jgi:uncharacterized protein (UPF0332 family)
VKESTARRLDKASRAIRAAELLLRAQDAEFAVGRAYYAMFYTAEALLNERGLRFREHGGVHGAFGEHFVKSGEFDQIYHRWLLEAFEERVTGDYGVETVAASEEEALMIERAREFLREARRYLGATP